MISAEGLAVGFLRKARSLRTLPITSVCRPKTWHQERHNAQPSISAGTVVEVFNDHEVVQAALRELKAVGFTDTQIGVVSPDMEWSPMGTLIQLRVSHDEAAHCENQLKAGNLVIVVRAGTRADIASCVLSRFHRACRNSSQAM